MSGTTDRAPFPNLDDAERVRHKGELVYPNLLLSLSADHVAAFVLRAIAVDRTEITCDLLFAPDEAAKPDVRSQRRGRSLGPGQPAGLGDLRVGAARHDIAVLHAGLVRADGGRVRGHPPMAAPPARGARLRVAETCDIAVVGLGALGSSTAWHAASRGMRVVGFDAFGFGHDRGASHDTSRIIRHSYHTPAYVALTFGAYDDWARLEEETGEQFVTVTGGLDLYPPWVPRSPRTTTRRRWTPTSIAYDVLDVDTVAQRWPAFSLPEGTVAIHQARTGIVPAAKGTAAMAQRAQDLGAVLHYDTRVESIRPGADGADVVTADGVISAARVVVTADAWTNDLLSATRRRPAADRHRRTGHLLRARSSLRTSAPTCSRCGSGWTSRATTASPPTESQPSRPPRTAAAPP